jgi:hypothetical protein
MAARSDIVSVVALSVSVVALCISAFQVWETREHDRATVKPLLDFSYETDDYEPQVGLKVKNVGLGPALIRSVQVYVDRKPVAGWDEAKTYGGFKKPDLISTLDFDKQSVLRVDEAEMLFGRASSNKTELDAFVNFVDQHLAVSISYCSIQHDCETRCSSESRC